MSSIYIVPIWNEENHNLEFLRVKISEVFKKKTVISQFKEIDLKSAYNPARRQYNSSQILIQLINNPPKDAYRILGVTDVDLFIPILTFVFGEAQLNGIGGIVSLHRLSNKFYGLPENLELMRKRLIKEAIHELGHTYGLVHCPRPGCVMNSSTYVEDIDEKTEFFCTACLAYIR